MKGALLIVAVFALALLVIPMIALNFQNGAAPADLPVHSPGAPTAPDEGAAAANANTPVEPDPAPQPEAAEQPGGDPAAGASVLGVSEFRILDESTGEVHTVSTRDYVRGAVAAEMPVSFHTEALKAQAVAAHTYALQHHLQQQQNPDPALKGADFSADPSNLKGYMTEASALAFYGERGELYWEKICAAADAVVDYVLVYDDAPIVAAYHAMSAGQTEDAANVWTGSADYLQPVDSEGDYLAPDFEVQEIFAPEELRDAMGLVDPSMDLSGPPDGWIGDTTRSASGYVTGIEIGGVEFHGKQVREALGLRSHNFDVQYTDAGFVFITYGHGHGVGLSQYGADHLARQGLDFAEILQHYYVGAELCAVVY